MNHRSSPCTGVTDVRQKMPVREVQQEALRSGGAKVENSITICEPSENKACPHEAPAHALPIRKILSVPYYQILVHEDA